jgi:predicted RNA binding protein YcfA (HicA-like mRNA interferase family)
VEFPSVGAKKLLKVLKKAPLSYRVVEQTGSHRKLESKNGYPPLNFAWHDGVEIPPGLVRRVLCHTIGLTEAEAKELI